MTSCSNALLLVLAASVQLLLGSSAVVPESAAAFLRASNDFDHLTEADVQQLLVERFADLPARAQPDPPPPSPAPLMSADMTASMILLLGKPGSNTTIVGNVFVSASSGKMRLSGSQWAEAASGTAKNVPTTLIVDKNAGTTTVIMQDPTTKKPHCVVQRTSYESVPTPAGGIPTGFNYVGNVLTTGSLTRAGTKTTVTFSDAFVATPVAVVESEGAGTNTVGLYGNVIMGPVSSNMFRVPSGMSCTHTEAALPTSTAAALHLAAHAIPWQK